MGTHAAEPVTIRPSLQAISGFPPSTMTHLQQQPSMEAAPQPQSAAGGPMPHDPRSPVYADDKFMMYCFKVRPCEKTYRHDWWACPFVHPAESAKRRDPRKYKYSAVACPNAKQGGHCPRGDRCPGTHSVFEYWLHPSRFRTQFCDRGIHCNQPFCFFAHTVEQLRMPSANDYTEGSQSPVAPEEISALDGLLDRSMSFDRTTSFDRSARSASFGRGTTPQFDRTSGGFDRSSSFDATSPRMARLSEIRTSIFSGAQNHAPLARRYSDFQGYEPAPSRTHTHMGDLSAPMPPRLMHKDRRAETQSFQQQDPHAQGMIPMSTPAQTGAMSRPHQGDHTRSLSLAPQDIGVLQEILERMSTTASGRQVLQATAAQSVNPPNWFHGHPGMGSPQSPLVDQNRAAVNGHDHMISKPNPDLEGVLSQLGLNLANTSLGLSN